jgi:hypothetical protein
VGDGYLGREGPKGALCVEEIILTPGDGSKDRFSKSSSKLSSFAAPSTTAARSLSFSNEFTNFVASAAFLEANSKEISSEFEPMMSPVVV